MTWSMFAVGYFSIKVTDTAMEYFLKGFPPFYEWYEAAGGAGCRGQFPQCYSNFITGAGGFLQSIWAGLGGLRFQETKLIITTAAYLTLAYLTAALDHWRYEAAKYLLPGQSTVDTLVPRAEQPISKCWAAARAVWLDPSEGQ